MIKKLGVILKKLVFAFGVLYGINLILNNVGFYLPINVATLAITSFLGTPGLLSLVAIFYILK